MKIAIGTKVQEGPWGGGNQFASSLKNFLESRGHEVFFNLDPKVKLDLILLTEPRQYLQTASFGPEEILEYLRHNWDTLVAHRINECDQRKDTKFVNRTLLRCSQLADHTIFISSWLKELFLQEGYRKERMSVIRNGADPSTFSPGAESDRFGAKRAGQISVVTHHWGSHQNKGWDIYGRLDEMISASEKFKQLEFTFIGNAPKGKRWKNISFVTPLSGRKLAEALADHDFYITASVNEPAGMHHIEAALCGLPLLYRESGALPEYCRGYGYGFTADNFEPQLEKMVDTFGELRSRMQLYPNTSQKMCREYEALFLSMVEERERLLASRKLRPGRLAPARLRWKAEMASVKLLSRLGFD